MENITMVLKYLQENEHIKFLNIDSSNILNKESKIVLSFIWYIIEYFSINKPLDSYFNVQHNKLPGKSTKQKFMNWLKCKVPITIRNLTSDCKSGRIIGALVNSCNKDLCKDWITWPDKDSMDHVKTAIELARKELGIPALIDPDELMNEKLDEKSVMTYLSQFLFYKGNLHIESKETIPNAQFKGLDQLSYRLNELVSFTVCSNEIESVRLQYTDPSGDKAFMECCNDPVNTDGNEGQYNFVPSKPGQYTLNVVSTKNRKTITSSIISVEPIVDQENSNENIFENNYFQQEDDHEFWESLLCFKGRGIQSVGIRRGDSVEFTIQMINSQKLKSENIVVQINSPDSTPLNFQKKLDNQSVLCSYNPSLIGLYEITVLMLIPKFQKVFAVNVAEACTTQIVAFGPGLRCASTSCAAIFLVETNGETGTLNFTIEGPNEAHIECTDNGDGSATVSYWPTTPGEYAIHILYENEDIQNSPFMANVSAQNSTIKTKDIKAYGSALCSGHLTVGQMAHFTVDLTKLNERLDLISVDCFDKFGETITVTRMTDVGNKRTYSLIPLSSVKLSLFISYDRICIPPSPYLIYVTEDRLSNKVRVQGSGVQSASIGVEAVFFVDCRLLTKDGQLKIIITDSNLNQIPCFIDKTSNNVKIYCARYNPVVNCEKCFIEIFYDDIPIYDEPLVVPILNVNLQIRRDKNIIQNDTGERLENFQNNELIFDSRDYSDIFLDPKAESYLRLIMPPDNYTDNITLSDLPLPPPDITDDSGDTSLDNAPAKFLLSTVLEESEDTCSVKDSVFSSDCHSRASAKEELSLSRKSSFTLTNSPNLLPSFIGSKPDATSDDPINLNCAWPLKPLVDQSKVIKRPSNILPPKTNQENATLAQLTDVNEFDEFFPLPEPPLESELLCYDNKRISEIFTSRLCHLAEDVDETRVMSPFKRSIQSITNGSFADELYIKVMTCIDELNLPSLIINWKSLFEPEYQLDLILHNDTAKIKQENDFESVLVDDKIESERSFSEMLPVTQMEVIVSPYEGCTNYLSDNSDNSLISDNTSMVFTAHFNYVNVPIDHIRMDTNQIDRIIVDRAFVVEHCLPSVKLVKEMTTSEVSEISETSLWVSNEEKINNFPLEFEDNSFINSLSDIPKSGIENLKINQPFKFIHDQNERFNNTNNCKCSTVATNWIADQNIVIDSVQPFLCNTSNGAMVKNSAVTQILCSQASAEFEVCTDSQSLSFPEPPSELINISTNKSNIYPKEDIRLKVPKKASHVKTHENVLNLPKVVQAEGASKDLRDIFSMPDRQSNDRASSSNRTNGNQISNSAPCAYLKTCKINIDNKSEFKKVFASVNTPLLASSETCLNDKIYRLSGDYVAPLEMDVNIGNPFGSRNRISFMDDCKRINEPFKLSNVSRDSLVTDDSDHIQCQRRKLQGKRRSLSQTVADSSTFQFDLQHTKNLVPNPLYKSAMAGMLYSNKQHVRAHSESDRLRITSSYLPEETIPTKQEKKEDIRLINNQINSKSSISTKETILRRQLPAMKDNSITELGEDNLSLDIIATKRMPLIGHGDKVSSSISVYGEGLSSASIGNIAEFVIRTNGNGTEGVSLSIEGPSKIDINTVNLPNGDCKVMYVPKSSGEYALIILQNGLQISGSPFKVTVTPHEMSTVVPAAKSPIRSAHAEGQGLVNAFTNYPNKFTIYTKDSGPGGLSLSIEGPSKAFIEFQDAKNGACGVTYRVTEPGVYTCIVKFNKNHIKNSPFSINVTSQQSVLTNVKETKVPSENANPIYQIGKRAIFSTESINLSLTGISKLIAVLFCPFGSKKQLTVHMDATKDCVWVEFIPYVEGRHHLYFMDESQRNEPLDDDNFFVLMVEEPSDFDQVCFERELRSIKVYGKGLVKGRAGYSNIFFIEIGESVSGALNVTVDGPSKVEIKCNETDKGFKFSYIPGIPGDYLVTIKYGGEKQIKGSPFQVKIVASNKSHKMSYGRRKAHSSPLSQSSNTELSTTLSSDNNTITCFGSGLHLGKLHMWMDFYVDASKTKTINHLFVGIIGPSEPCDEIRICYMESYRFLVSYKARERGSHQLILKWGDTHISCSPSTIEVE